MEEDKNLEQNLDKSNEKLHIVSCPKCNSSWIGDIGYGNCECWMCGNVFKLKSKTGLEEDTSSSISDFSDSYDFENFLYKFAEDNFGFDPEGNPAYYVDYHREVISMGTMVNPKFQSSAVMNLNKDEVKNSMIELAQELINNIKENFNKDYYIEFTIVNDKKHGFILRSR